MLTLSIADFYTRPQKRTIVASNYEVEAMAGLGF